MRIRKRVLYLVVRVRLMRSLRLSSRKTEAPQQRWKQVFSLRSACTFFDILLQLCAWCDREFPHEDSIVIVGLVLSTCPWNSCVFFIEHWTLSIEHYINSYALSGKRNYGNKGNERAARAIESLLSLGRVAFEEDDSQMDSFFKIDNAVKDVWAYRFCTLW